MYLKIIFVVAIAVQQVGNSVAGPHLAAESCGEQSDESVRLRRLANLSGHWLGHIQISGESHVPHHDNEPVARRGARCVNLLKLIFEVHLWLITRLIYICIYIFVCFKCIFEIHLYLVSFV